MSLKDKLLNEETSSGGYPNDGFGGPASDDDGSPGTTVFGDKMVPVEVPNRLTGSFLKYVPADDLEQNWNYDEFDMSKGMGSHKAYSKTLNSLKDILGNRLWKRTDRRSMEMFDDKEDAYDDSEVDQTEKLSHDNEETADLEDVEVDITERINKYLSINTEEEVINEEVLATNDRKSLARAIMSGKSSKIKMKSLNVDAAIVNDDDQVNVIYPKNDDFTMALVDVADALGTQFTMGKNGKNVEFTLYLD